MELTVTFTIIKYCSHDFVQFYSPNCGKNKGDKEKVVKNILLVVSDFFQEYFKSLAWREKEEEKNNFHT